MKFDFDIIGMSCSACSSRIEATVSKVKGVNSVAVNLLTNSMQVECDCDSTDIIAAVESIGYKANVAVNQHTSDLSFEKSIKEIKSRIEFSLLFLAPLFYFSMMHDMFHAPVGRFLAENTFFLKMLQMLLSGIIIWINKKFYISGIKGVIHKAPNMDSLVTLGSLVSFLWSIYVLYLIGAEKNIENHSTYFESAAMILVLISVGKLLEAKSKGKSVASLKSLMDLAPQYATKLIDGKEEKVKASELNIGDVFIVKPGEVIPIDGQIINGQTTVDEARLTGESLPIIKKEGDLVFAPTINLNGKLVCTVKKEYADTTFSNVIKLVNDTAASKAPVAKISDKISGIFVPIVLGIALLTFLLWLIVGEKLDFAIARAIAVLVISCPCALGLATPVAIVVGSSKGATHGILFKGAQILERAGKIDIVAFDKTGTLTVGRPVVVSYQIMARISAEEFFSLSYALEKNSSHPYASAIIDEAKHHALSDYLIQNFEEIPGYGVKGIINSDCVYAGSYKFIKQHIKAESFEKIQVDESTSVVYFARNGKLIGLCNIADEIRTDAVETIEELRKLNKTVVMISGDNENAARNVASQLGIEHVISNVLPDKKCQVIEKLKQFGSVAMVGDGINDAPALVNADIGIALNSGTDIAIDAADIVLMRNSLKDVVAAIRLSKITLKVIYENLFWAFAYNVFCIPLAAGVYFKAFHVVLNPMIGAIAMSLSSICVVTNSLRINLFDIFSKKMDNRRIEHTREGMNLYFELEEDVLKKTIQIEGMMCPHCEAHMKAALEALDGVENADCSFKEKRAIVSLTHDIDSAVFKTTVEDAGYEYVGILSEN